MSSFQLHGSIRIKDDGATKTLAKVDKQLEAVRKATDGYLNSNKALSTQQKNIASTSNRVQNALRGVSTSARVAGTSMRSAGSGASRLVRNIGLVAAAYTAARVASGMFNKTVGAAANYEMSAVTVDAMFGKANAKAAKTYFDYVEKRSAESMFSQDDFLTAGKSFIPTTKDNKSLEKMLNLAERLGAIDPEQGLTGAAYALKEMFSGDAVSLVERFELPRSAMNEIKKLPIKQQLKVLDKYLDGIGATNELIGAQSSTTMGQYRKSLAQINKAFREIGTGALKSINPLLKDFNKWMKGSDFTRFKNAGIGAMTAFFNGTTKMVRKAASYLDTNFISNPAFNNLPDIPAKIAFIFDNFSDTYKKWYDGGGSTQISDSISGVITYMSDLLKTNQETIVSAALTLGAAVGKGVFDGFTKFMSDNPLAAGGVAMAMTPGGLPTKLAVGATTAGGGIVVNAYDDIVDGFKKFPNAMADSFLGNYSGNSSRPATTQASKYTAPSSNTPYRSGTQIFEDRVKSPFGSGGIGKSGGIDNVPFNNFPARLHSGEAVLTRTENKEYRENGGNSGGGAPFIINMHGTVIREEADIQRVAGQLARLMAT